MEHQKRYSSSSNDKFCFDVEYADPEREHSIVKGQKRGEQKQKAATLPTLPRASKEIPPDSTDDEGSGDSMIGPPSSKPKEVQGYAEKARCQLSSDSDSEESKCSNGGELSNAMIYY